MPRISLSGRDLTYELIRASRRTVGLRVHNGQLIVRAHPRVSQTWIEQWLVQKSDWIDRQLERHRHLQGDGGCYPLEWDAPQPVLGEEFRVCRLAGKGRTSLDGERRVLELALPDTAGSLDMRVPLERLLRRHLALHVSARVKHFAPRMGVAPTTIALSSARTRWGSASASGVIRLSWRLVFLSPDLVDYVVAHELAHLKEMNHGPHFWSHVAQQIPDLPSVRARMREQRLPDWLEKR